MKSSTTSSRLILASLATLAIGTGAAMGFARVESAAKGSPYPLATCPVSGKPLTKDAAVLVMEDPANPLNNGREIRFCCPNCIDPFKADPSKFLPAIDAAIIATGSLRALLAHPLQHSLTSRSPMTMSAGSSGSASPEIGHVTST